MTAAAATAWDDAGGRGGNGPLGAGSRGENLLEDVTAGVPPTVADVLSAVPPRGAMKNGTGLRTLMLGRPKDMLVEECLLPPLLLSRRAGFVALCAPASARVAPMSAVGTRAPNATVDGVPPSVGSGMGKLFWARGEPNGENPSTGSPVSEEIISPEVRFCLDGDAMKLGVAGMLLVALK